MKEQRRMKRRPPILLNKHYTEPTVFTVDNLLRESRRQKSLSQEQVPPICLLDPDGDIVRWLLQTHDITRDTNWACYHTDLYRFIYQGIQFGIIGCAVGASFAVLVAEELFASGVELVISVSSAGQITAVEDPPYFVLIERALRDEGTSYHYLPPSDFSYMAPELRSMLDPVFSQVRVPVYCGSTWTTDAPFRETESAIACCRALGIMAVEMEAAALYALAQAKRKSIVCLAYVTNQMAQSEGDFEKGIANGSHDALHVVFLMAKVWENRRKGTPVSN